MSKEQIKEFIEKYLSLMFGDEIIEKYDPKEDWEACKIGRRIQLEDFSDYPHYKDYKEHIRKKTPSYFCYHNRKASDYGKVFREKIFDFIKKKKFTTNQLIETLEEMDNLFPLEFFWVVYYLDREKLLVSDWFEKIYFKKIEKRLQSAMKHKSIAWAMDTASIYVYIYDYLIIKTSANGSINSERVYNLVSQIIDYMVSGWLTQTWYPMCIDLINMIPNPTQNFINKFLENLDFSGRRIDKESDKNNDSTPISHVLNYRMVFQTKGEHEAFEKIKNIFLKLPVEQRKQYLEYDWFINNQLDGSTDYPNLFRFSKEYFYPIFYPELSADNQEEPILFNVDEKESQPKLVKKKTPSKKDKQD